MWYPPPPTSRSPRTRFDPYAWRQVCPCRRVIVSSLRNCQSFHLRSLAETKTEVTDTSKSSQEAERKSKKKKEDDEVVQVEVTAKLGGIAVTVTSVEGDLSHIIIGGNYLGLFFF